MALFLNKYKCQVLVQPWNVLLLDSPTSHVFYSDVARHGYENLPQATILLPYH